MKFFQPTNINSVDVPELTQNLKAYAFTWIKSSNIYVRFNTIFDHILIFSKNDTRFLLELPKPAKINLNTQGSDHFKVFTLN